MKAWPIMDSPEFQARVEELRAAVATHPKVLSLLGWLVMLANMDEELRASLDRLARWDDDNYEGDTSDDLHRHFGAITFRDWCEVSDEARHLYNWMFDERVEGLSPLDGIWSAAAAQATSVAFASCAAALGINDLEAFEMVMGEWYDATDALPPPCTLAQLKAKVRKERRFLDDLHAGREC